jgi:hypothetical protein
MNNASAILRTLIVYAICVPLAIWLGYLLTSFEDFSRSTFIEAGIFVVILCLPLLLRWHYTLLVLSLNMGLSVFFLPGRPPIWLLMLALSLGISILQRTLNRGMHFISAPRLSRPLICLAVVVLVTCKLTGGIGLNSFGSENVGGKKYFFVLGGILAYFALTARRIPPQQAGLYMALFFLPPCLNAVGDLVSILPPAFNFIYWFFPANAFMLGDLQQGSDGGYRYGGIAAMSTAVFTFMLAKHGIRGIFMSGKPFRVVFFLGFSSLVFLGGFRSMVISMALIFAILFFLEGLHHTKLLARFAFTGLVAGGLIVGFASHLPYAVQRAISFLPVEVDASARADAEGSQEWRYEIWNAELSQVPEYLLLGKGYGISQQDFEFVGSSGFRTFSADEMASAVAGDYHNGPLSVVLPFGIWGVLALIWLWVAGFHALYDNYRYGEESLRTVNTLMLAAFVAEILKFILVFGALESDTIGFAAMLGLSVSLNGGIRRPAMEPAKTAASQFTRPRLEAVFQR